MSKVDDEELDTFYEKVKEFEEFGLKNDDFLLLIGVSGDRYEDNVYRIEIYIEDEWEQIIREPSFSRAMEKLEKYCDDLSIEQLKQIDLTLLGYADAR